MTYLELQKKVEDRFSALPVFYAFSNEQLQKGCEKLGVTEPTKELVSLGAGGYIRKVDRALLNETLTLCERERDEFLSVPINLRDAFRYELANHEYCINEDDEEVWEAVGLDIRKATEVQRSTFNTARDLYLGSVIY